MTDEFEPILDSIGDAMLEVYKPSARPSPTVRPPFRFISTSELMKMDFPPIQWAIPGHVAPGLTLLVGRQKLGKTWLAMNWAIAVADGGLAMGAVECEQGDVLYIDLENGPRRLQQRLAKMDPSLTSRPEFPHLIWLTDAPPIGPEFFTLLENWAAGVATPKLIVVDVFQRVRPKSTGQGNAYEMDYAALSPLHKWALEHNISVVLLHHTKKGEMSDPLESVSGSNGLSACADTTIILDKKGEDITLYLRGRDVEESTVPLKFSDGHWEILDPAGGSRLTGQREQIRAALSNNGDPMTPSQISDATGMKSENVRKLLRSMVNDREIAYPERGKYVLFPAMDGDHIDHKLTTRE